MLLQKDFEHIVQKRTHELWKRTGILENCISTQVEMMYDIRIRTITIINIAWSNFLIWWLKELEFLRYILSVFKFER